MGDVFPDDVVIGLLHHLPEADEGTLTADREAVHRAFYALKEKAPEIMKSISFRRRGLFPESSDLDETLANLEMAGLIHRKNETPRFYFIDKALHTSYERFVSKRLKEASFEEQVMKGLANELRQQVSCAT